MRPDVHPHDYRFITPSGEVLQTGSTVGIADAARAVAQLSGFPFSYQVVHRALRAAGVWVGSYRPGSPTARPVLVVIERSDAASDQLPPP